MLSLLHKTDVLLLEDDPSMQRLVSTLLKRNGHRVEIVSNGNDALEAIGKNHFDAILLDMMMPNEGGVTVVAQLRNRIPDVLNRVIVLTGAPDSVLRLVEKDVFAIVRKPFEAPDLVAAVARCIEAQ